MNRWTPADLAEAMSRNPSLRVNHPKKAGKGSHPTPKPATAPAIAQKPRSSKYRNQKTEVDGIIFDSKKEAGRYQELKTLEQAGKIRDLKLQPKYPLKVNGKLVANYIGDFAYWDAQSLISVVEDVKSLPTKTRVYRLKKKLVEALYGIIITEV